MMSNRRICIRWSSILWVLLCTSSQVSLFALNSDRDISQLAHTAWRIQDGAFRGAPNAVAQTKDGYLWIGTDGGLVRFDGVRFVSWRPPKGEQLLDPRVFSLLGGRDGSLWIGTGYSVSKWQDGRFTNYPQLSGRIESIAEDADGAIWLVRTQITDGMGPVCRIKSEQLQCYGKAEGIPFPIAVQLTVDSAGELWVGGYSELCRWRPGSSSSNCAGNATRTPETFAALKAVAAGRDGTVWVAVDRAGPVLQLDRWERGNWTKRTFPGIAVSNSDITTLFIDRDNALWIGTANHGMFRVMGGSIENYRHADGLSSDAVGRFYQDREGTIWAVTSAGIDNFHDVKVVSYSMREGLAAAGAGTVLGTRDGSVWIGNFHALDLLRDGKLAAIRSGHGLPGKYVTTFFEDHAGRLWVGIDDGLWVYDGGVFRAVRRADGSALGIVFAITEDTRHYIWARAGSKLDRIDNLQLQSEDTSPQISTAYTLAANPNGGIYLGLVDGDLAEYEDGKTRTYPSNEVGNTRQIRDLLVEADGSVWGTTLDELARWKGGVRKNLNTRNGLPCDEIFALVKDGRGALWLDSKCGLIEIERSELDNWWEHPESLVKFKLLDEFDGVQAGLTPLKPQATLSRDGRLWFVNGRILQGVDPNQLQSNPVPPPVQIEEVFADRRSYFPGADLRLPALTGDLEIDYTALSFVAPQKVHFRYKLEGHDSNWQEPGTRRQAFYSGLPPGPYRFRVIACNNDGVWNEAGATLFFSILPAFYQTTWFRALCAAGFLALLWAIYQVRVQQLHRRFNIALDARVNERTRIARELHDTLLQSFHGLMFRFQAARNMLPRRPEEAIQALDGAISRAEQALTESRGAIQDLRSNVQDRRTLEESLAALCNDLTSRSAMQGSPQFQVVVEGEQQNLSPVFQSEVYRISCELLQNAFRHAAAEQIEAEIRYDRQLFRLRIRDDGKGIDKSVLEKGGPEGHWGLRGVRERAQRIGARLDIWSESEVGTEIQLSVPATLAYDNWRESSRLRLFGKAKRDGS